VDWYKHAVNIAFVYDDEHMFIQIDLSEAVLYVVGAIFRRFRYFLYSVIEYLWDH
jgi:hypothetical protein